MDKELSNDIKILCSNEDFWKVYEKYFIPEIENIKDITCDIIVPKELENLTP